jgi:hypothetical protein
MKFLLLPFTFVFFAFVVYSLLYLSAIGLFVYLFPLSWVWIILISTISSSTILGITFYLDTHDGFFKIYNFSLASSIIHTLAVVIGAILGIKAVMLMQIPIKSLWEISWLKTIILSLQFIAILRIIILFGIMAPTTNLVNGNTK